MYLSQKNYKKISDIIYKLIEISLKNTEDKKEVAKIFELKSNFYDVTFDIFQKKTRRLNNKPKRVHVTRRA